MLGLVRALALFALADGLAGEVFEQPGHGGVRLAVHVRGDVHVRVLDGPVFGIETADGVAHRREGVAVAGLVAERPQDDAGMSAIAHDHALDAGERGRKPLGAVARQDAAVVAETVALDIGLVHDEHAEAVADRVEARVVGVVAGADAVEVRALDPAHVVEDRFGREGLSAFGIEFVAVDAADLDHAPVEAKSLRRELDAADAQVAPAGLDDASLGVEQFDHGPVEAGRLVRPEFGRGKFQRALGAVAVEWDFEVGVEPGAVGRPELEAERPARRDGGVELAGEAEGGAAEVVGEVGVELPVAQMDGGKGGEEDVAEDAAQPPHVLILQIRAGAEAPDLRRHGVFAGDERGGDVELGGQAGILGVADAVAVDGEFEGGADAGEVEADLPSGPVGRDVEAAAVETDGVAFARGGPGRRRLVHDARRVGGEGVGVVCVERRAVAVQLPIGGHGDGAPGLRALVGQLGGGRRPAERPVAVEADRRRRFVVRGRARGRRVGAGPVAGPGR